MNRRSFLAALAAVPFLGFLRPKPVVGFSVCRHGETEPYMVFMASPKPARLRYVTVKGHRFPLARDQRGHWRQFIGFRPSPVGLPWLLEMGVREREIPGDFLQCCMLDMDAAMRSYIRRPGP